MADALDRIAEGGPLNAADMEFLDSLGDNAPRAASHAVKYLTFWLENPEQRNAEFGPRSSELEHCVDILLRFPDQAKQVEEKLQQALAAPKGTLDDADRAQLLRLWKRLR